MAQTGARGGADVACVRRDHPLKVEAMSDPADPDRAVYENGALLPGCGAMLAGPTFAEWLETET